MRQTINYKKLYWLGLLGLVLVSLATTAQAAPPTIEIQLPGLTAQAAADPGTYIKYLFIFGLSLAGFLAVGAIIFGGIQYMAAGTSLTSVQRGKAYIYGALGGIALLLCSALILQTIDPSLLQLSPQITPLDNINAPSGNNPSCPTQQSCGVGYYWNASSCSCEVDTSLN